MLSLIENIFSVNKSTFETVALQVFKHQFSNVDVYRAYCQSLRRTPDSVHTLAQIPFLPIELFKSHVVIQSGLTAQHIFESSGTTGVIPSRHHVTNIALYERSFITAFELFYGKPEEYVVLGLLPSYLERTGSSLVYMVDKLMKLSGKPENGFFLKEFDTLYQLLLKLKAEKKKAILLGVTFALLDFAEMFKVDFQELIVMETGGMKGRREELTREEVHERLCAAFGVKHIHSEYGMTELLSQGYSKGDGIFESPPWMKILTRDVYDPLKLQENGKAGAVNVVDLANLFSSSFIATSDIAQVYENGGFSILGRMDNAEVRGCNLMVI